MKQTLLSNQTIIHYFRPIIGGIIATFGSFLFVSIEISIVATILTFKGKGTLDNAILQPYIDTIIQLTGVPSHLLMVVIVTLYITLKWNQSTLFDQLLLTTSTFISIYWLGNHFKVLNQMTNWTLAILYLIIYATGHAGIALAPRYQNWKKNNHLKNSYKLFKPYNLTPRETEIVLALLKGKSNKEIGNELYIEEGTVKQHLKIIFKKTNSKRRTELISKINASKK